MELKAFKQRFDPVFTNEIRAEVSRLNDLAIDAVLRNAFEQVVTLATAGGKRVRPFAATLMYTAFGGQITDEWLRFVSGLEAFHLFALIHDDIIDHADVRHGKETLHRLWERLLREGGRVGEIEHVSRGQAMLIGDLIHAAANRLMWYGTPGADRDRHNQALEEYASMVREVMVGEMIDVDSATRLEAAPELILAKMRLKTASYTFVRPLRIGACMAGAPVEVLDACTRFGLALGMAFQIQDDYLDLSQPTGEMGKKPFTDLRERQHTVFTQHIVEHGTESERAQLTAMLGAPLEEADREQVRTLFEQSGALQAGRHAMEAYFDEALGELGAMSLPLTHQEAFKGLVGFIRQRTY